MRRAAILSTVDARWAEYREAISAYGRYRRCLAKHHAETRARGFETTNPGMRAMLAMAGVRLAAAYGKFPPEEIDDADDIMAGMVQIVRAVDAELGFDFKFHYPQPPRPATGDDIDGFRIR